MAGAGPGSNTVHMTVTASSARVDPLNNSQSDLIGVSDRPERTIEPQRPPQPVGTRGGPRQPEPLAVNLVRLRRIHADVAVPIVRPCFFERHPLMPAVHAADRIRLHREREVLVDTDVA